MLSFLLSSYHRGFFGKTQWDSFSESCCNGSAPSQTTCTIGEDASPCTAIAINLIVSVSGSGMNLYNVYSDCEVPKKRLQPKQGFSTAADGVSDFSQLKQNLMLDSPCHDSCHMEQYLGSIEARKALHVPNRVQSWQLCTSLFYRRQYASLPGGLMPQVKQLLESERGLTLLVYMGDVDMVCNFLGGDEWFVDDLDRQLLKDYSSWHVDGQVAGWVKHYKGITFATVRGAGHLDPKDKPAAALAMASKFLHSKHGNVHLEEEDDSLGE